MLEAMSGQVINKTIVVDGDLSEYEGTELIVTFLKEKNKAPSVNSMIDFSKYGHRTDRGQHVDEYMEEMRGNDRI